MRFRDEVSLWGTEGRGDFVRVRYEGPDGSVLHGWVRRRDVRPGPAILHGGARDYAGAPACGRGTIRGPKIRMGPAVAPPGTPVYAAPGKGPWARVGTSSPFVALWRAGDPWTRIVAVDGLSEGDPYTQDACAPLEHAWIASDAVRFVDP
ncbi:MAG: hypothetical protein D6705_18240 [Deltaproteobacteria bacterium]|nr:MAG: hypothetical protein D6705_18240 [Deltaproteobacteria bacterium]